MPRVPRAVPLCEQHVGCPTCKAKPRERCVTVRPLHMPPWSEQELRAVGQPTAPHAARWRLYAHLWRLT